jgi:hypothetical protein
MGKLYRRSKLLPPETMSLLPTCALPERLFLGKPWGLSPLSYHGVTWHPSCPRLS